MDLLQFVELVRQGASVKEIIASRVLCLDGEAIGVYMEDKAGLTSQLAFFDLARVPAHIFITVDEKRYEAFFSASELADLIPEYANFLGTAATPLTIAETILDYREYDA